MPNGASIWQEGLRAMKRRMEGISRQKKPDVLLVVATLLSIFARKKTNPAKKEYPMKRELSKSQATCIALLWIALCYIVLTTAERIDGPTVLTLLISAALVFIPVVKALRKE